MLKLLVVDDNPADIELLCDAIRELALPVEIAIAENGMQAFEVLKKVAAAQAPAPTGILLDLNMPRVHGREVLSFIKETKTLSGIPTFVVTSSSSLSDRQDCLARGADAYFTKPGSLEDLNQFVKQIATMLGHEPPRTRFDHTPPSATAVVAGIFQAIRQLFARRRLPIRIRSGAACSP